MKERPRRSSWSAVQATDVDFRRWGSGFVDTAKDLSSPVVFGTSRDLECECGRLAGPQFVGQRCVECGTTVEENSRAARSRRIGLIRLPVWYRHPLTFQPLTIIPVLPIAFRINSDGEGGPWNRIYEELVRYAESVASQERADSLKKSLPLIDDDGNNVWLTQKICELLGIERPMPPNEEIDWLVLQRVVADSLLSQSIALLLSGSRDVDVFFRCSGIGITFESTV